MSNRVVAIKILGVGQDGIDAPATFTTRAHPLYPAALDGTVVSLTDQLSSEIAVFGTMGSDSTTSFTILSTAATRSILMSRGKVEVLDPYRNEPLRLTDYIPPDPGPVTLNVNATNLVAGDRYRIQNTAFKCLSVSPVVFERTWGCAPVPIAMVQQSEDSVIGSKIYNVSNGNPLGGCEQLPVIIETVDLDSMTPEVIFRGYISKVSNDTSSGQQNLIKVDCSSMMAYLKQAPFVPAWGTVATNPAAGSQSGIFTRSESSFTAIVQQSTYWNPRLFGDIYDPLAPVTAATVSTLWQVREGDKGGIAERVTFADGTVGISSEYNVTFGGGATVTDNGYRMSFMSGYYLKGDYGPELEVDFDITVGAEGTRRRVRRWSSRYMAQKPGLRGENCFAGGSTALLILDLLLGTYNADLTFASGARSVNESAWLPFPSTTISDLIDIPSLFAVFAGLDMPDIVWVADLTQAQSVGYLLPYEPANAKTVGEVLEAILKRLGAYMVYDAGKFYFGSWAGKRQVPASVTDSALSDPSIKLTFDRGTCLMRVNVSYADYLLDFVKYEVPYNNIDLSTSGLGKEMSVSHWQIPFWSPDDADWGLSRMVANAFGLIMRYSQSAARIDLSLRDSVVDLQVGQEVALTSQYLVNSEGEMGVQALTGYVLKAARSWQTPTTAYTIILPGYLSPMNKVSVWSCSARVEDVPGGDNIQVEANYFTAVPDVASPGAPATDAAAFKLTYDLIGAWYDVQLLDTYGTLKYQGALTGITGNFLDLPGFDAYAVPGDIIVLAPATSFSTNELSLIWDVFQADTSAQVDGSTDNARKWVP